MSSAQWFYYSNDKQVGPVSEAELKVAIVDGKINVHDYIYTDGYSDWKMLKEAPEYSKYCQVGAVPPPPGNSGKLPNRPRAKLQENAIAHNDQSLAKGAILNISTTGVFFETKDNVFKVNEEIKLTLKEGKGLGKPIHLKARVVRHAKDTDKSGYGLELKDVDDKVIERIDDFVKRNAS